MNESFPRQNVSTNDLMENRSGIPFLSSLKNENVTGFGRGVVTSVQREDALDGGGALERVYGSVNIIPTDLLQSSEPLAEIGEWFRPLLPIHLMVLPEIGEEVLTIDLGGIERYYIGRTNNTNRLNRAVVGHNIPGTATFKGIPFNPQKLASGLNDRNIVLKPITRSGDVIIFGRTGSFLQQTYDEETLGGVLNLSTQTTGTGNLIGKSAAKLVLAENSDVDISLGIGSSNRGSFGVLAADNIRIYSVTSDSPLQPVVLGNENNAWLTNLVGDIGELVNTVKELVNFISEHEHNTIVQDTDVDTAVDVNDITVETEASVDVRLPVAATVTVDTETGIGRAFGLATGKINFLATGTGSGTGVGRGEVTGLGRGKTSLPLASTDSIVTRIDDIVERLKEDVNNVNTNLSSVVRIN